MARRLPKEKRLPFVKAELTPRHQVAVENLEDRIVLQVLEHLRETIEARTACLP